MRPFISIIAGIFAVAVFGIADKTIFSQVSTESKPIVLEACGHSKSVRDPLIDEAERGQFNVRRVEFVGSTYTRGRDLFKQARSVNEGDIFTRENLEIAVKRISKMRTVYPITMDNVEARLDRSDKSVDIVFCIKQKPRR